MAVICPRCGSDDIMKNGTTRRGKQNHKYRDCDRQFVENPQWQPKDKATCSLIDRVRSLCQYVEVLEVA